VAEGKVRPETLTTHRFAIEQAAAAYDVIMGKVREDRDTDGGRLGSSEPQVAKPNGIETLLPGPAYRCGVVLVYAGDAAVSESRVINASAKKSTPGDVGIGFIGAGNFARGVLLPIVARSSKVKLTGVASATGLSSKNTAEQFGFEYSTSDFGEILDDPSTNCVFITTRHDSHAAIAAECLRRGKSVFVEKPLAITKEGLQEVVDSAHSSEGHLFVGYNRRFSPLALEIKGKLGGRGPISITYRVNAGSLPEEHWSHDPGQGGGRIVGEVCHFIDVVQYLTDALPVKVSAEAVRASAIAGSVDDSCTISVRMSDGSIASIAYYASGDQSLGKERIEVYAGGSVGIIDDFRSGELVRAGKSTKLGGGRQDKGHAGEIAAFLDAVSGGSGSPFTLKSLVATTLTTFAINESLRSSESRAVDLDGFFRRD